MVSFRFLHDYIYPVEAYIVVGVFAIVLAFLIRRFLRYRTTRSIMLAVPAAVIIYLIIAVGMDAYVANYPRRTFNSESWRSAPDKRYEMIDDLLAKDVLHGLTAEQVISLVGPSDYQNGDPGHLEYRIGQTPAFMFLPIPGAEEDALQVRLENGVVSKIDLFLGP